MEDVNNVVVIGRLTRDCDIKYTASGFAVSVGSIAVNRRVKKGEQWEDEASFFDIKILGKTAEALKTYLTKGKRICVTGYLKQERWTDKESNQQRSKIVVMCDKIQLLDAKEKSENSEKTQFAPKSSEDVIDVESSSSTIDFEDEIPF